MHVIQGIFEIAVARPSGSAQVHVNRAFPDGRATAKTILNGSLDSFAAARNNARRRLCAGAALVLLLCVLAALGAQLGGCAQRAKRPARPVLVATIIPLADVCRQLGGAGVDVRTLIDSGQSPHEFKPLPEHAEAIADCSVLVLVGGGFDDWAERSAPVKLGGVKVIKFADSVQRAAQHAPSSSTVPELEQDHPRVEHLHGNAHYWLDPLLTIEFAEDLTAALEQLLPEDRAGLAERSRRFIQQVREIDQEYRNALRAPKRRTFVSIHSAFGYLAARYGLTEKSVIREDMRAPGPLELERVINFIRENGIKTIFSEPEFPLGHVQQIARETGANVARLDPLGKPGIAGYDSYQALMRSNLKQLERALNE